LTERIGERDRFAVEFELLEKSGGPWMYGHCCYWCDGRRVGDSAVATSLRDFLFQLEGMRRDVGRRKNPRFLDMSPIEFFRIVDAGLFGERDLGPVELAEKEQWARHNINPSIESFDHSKIYLVEDEVVGRAVFADEPYRTINHTDLNAGEVDAVLESTRTLLGGIYDSAIAAGGGP